MIESNEVAVPYRTQTETKYGLMYEDELQLVARWTFSPSKEACEVITFEEIYTSKATGEVVKHSAHKYLSQGLPAEAAVGYVNQPVFADPLQQAQILNQADRGGQCETS